MNQPSLSITDLTKVYSGSKVPALDKLTLQVQPGEVYGFLGANGAGKSTTIRLLMNFLQPTAGTASIMGRDIVRDSVAVKSHVGYLAGDVALYDKMTGRQFLDYMNELQLRPATDYLSELLADFETNTDMPLSDLSKGNRQKFGLIQALMHQPDVLILDEPTGGLDPLMQEVFFAHVKRAKQRGASVFLSSHNLAEVQRICDRIGFIRHGRLVREQILGELAETAAQTFDLVFSEKAPLADLKRITKATITTSRDPRSVTVTLPAASFTEFFGVLAAHNVMHFSQRDLNLEDEFINLYGEENDA